MEMIVSKRQTFPIHAGECREDQALADKKGIE